MHGISGLLATTLRWRGDADWEDFLTAQREHIARRHLRIQRLIAGIDELLCRRGIAGLALKGSALHAEGIYQPGERPMADVDLLVRPEHVTGAAEVLAVLGFRESSRTARERVFSPEHSRQPAPFGDHADNDMAVELHERIVESLPIRLTDITHHVFPRDTVSGLAAYPSVAALMGHLLLHAAGGFVDRSLRMIQLHDIALLARRLTPADWQRILSWDPWWVFPPLTLAERYYGAIAPDEFMRRAREYCPPILGHVSLQQLLSDVSLSQLWVAAFPGLAWARSTWEAGSYIAHRMLPSEQVRSERRLQLATMPGLSEGDWARLPQGRRIMRFLTSRTPRPLPLHSMRLALAQRR
jgi:hypothetical protein